MTSESLLHGYLDEKMSMAIHFFEGKPLIDGLAKIHRRSGSDMKFFRDCVLTFQPMIAFLKPGEGLGLYVDSENPYFRIKLETNSSGAVRTLLLPDEFLDCPESFSGECRLSKTFARGQTPYTTVLKLEDVGFSQLSNQVLNDSYQVEGKVYVSEKAENSLLILRLPEPREKQHDEERTIQKYWEMKGELFRQLLDLSDSSKIKGSFEKNEFHFLQSKEVRLVCTCSKDRLRETLQSLTQNSLEELIDPEKNAIDVKCDYCKTHYLYKLEELKPKLN